MEKLQVYFNEYNIPMENTIYLPLVSGLLRSYVSIVPIINEKYSFEPFIFMRDNPEYILPHYHNPAVAAFSASMWNINLSLAVAKQVKNKFPKCLIIFGGPSTPFMAQDFFESHPFVDVTVRGEGEQTFADLLIRFLYSRDFKGIPGISYRDPESGKCVRNKEERKPQKNLDSFPSPYLEGVFDYLIGRHINFQAIIETSRGCPFLCSYCFWGQGGLNKGFRFFSLERVKKVVEWCGANKIKYVFCADSNFGMFKRDNEIANYFVQTKLEYGFPEKFRVCYGKNAENNIFEIGKLLTKYNMDKGITISRQSNSPDALSNVRRKNISVTFYNNLQKRYNKENIPVYTELILGLPGETYQSFLKGIEEILQSGIKNQLFVYFCQVYPNSELADEDYRKKFKILTVSIPLNEVHATPRPEGLVDEYEEIVVSTISMSVEEWKKLAVISWIMQLFHGLKLGFFILAYLSDRYHIKYTGFFEYLAILKIKSGRIKILKNEVLNFYKAVELILQGDSRGRIVSDFGPIYWEQEEASFLNISQDKVSFYIEMLELTKEYLDSINVKYDGNELEEVVNYQKMLVPDYKPFRKEEYYFRYNVPEYFDTYFLENRSKLHKVPQVMNIVDNKNYNGDKKIFAKETILFGRKSNTILHLVKWISAHKKTEKTPEVKL